MDLIDTAVSAITNTVPAGGAPDEKAAIRAACNAGFNAPPGAVIPPEFERFPLLAEWFSIGLNAQVRFSHTVKPDEFGFGQ
ncbi:hypothetical protein ALQ79_200774 [Pseudomonas amygdali pv. lachrymans]|nr:hypothetical protein ALQ79_200774 [Pseudomonas amygdali pv. lachrymans]